MLKPASKINSMILFMTISDDELRIEKRLGLILKAFRSLNKIMRFRFKEGHLKRISHIRHKDILIDVGCSKEHRLNRVYRHEQVGVCDLNKGD
jgi:hypothetical protein